MTIHPILRRGEDTVYGKVALLVGMMVSKYACGTEYGVILLPTEDDTRQIQKTSNELKQSFVQNNIPFNHEENMIHVSIFQGVFHREGLEKLKKELSGYAKRIQPITVGAHEKPWDTQENIFLNLETTEEITTLFDGFFKEKLHELRDQGALMAQVKRDLEGGLCQDKVKKIQTYGLYWNIPGQYDPHVTLVYGSNKDDNISGILQNHRFGKDHVTLDRIAIGTLGFEGNIKEILVTYDLGSAGPTGF